MLNIYVDADACPVKEEVYRVARRYKLNITLVANSWMRIPDESRIRLEVVREGLDAADDWIADKVECDDIVISADIPLAARCLEKGAVVIGPTGRPFTEDNIGEVMATRGLLSDLRQGGEFLGSPPPFARKDRSRFLQQLDEAVCTIHRKQS